MKDVLYSWAVAERDPSVAGKNTACALMILYSLGLVDYKNASNCLLALRIERIGIV